LVATLFYGTVKAQSRQVQDVSAWILMIYKTPVTISKELSISISLRGAGSK
jgi:hypothetical protein